MDCKLKYGEVYNLNIKDEKVKGIYLGQTVSGKRSRLNHVILVNKGIGDLARFSYCILRFNGYKFSMEDNLILLKTHNIIPPANERKYLEELLEKIS